MVLVIGAVAMAAATAFATGLGTHAADSVTAPHPRLVSASTAEQFGDCGGATFLPAATAKRVLAAPVPQRWEDGIQKLDGAAFVDRDTVLVSIQGGSARVVTLTGITFRAKRLPRPAGAIFDQPCGGAGEGRKVVADLDRDPPRIVASSADGGIAGAKIDGRLVTKPIRFPWTVSLKDPLLLQVEATVDRCFCRWSAEVTWMSGAEHGTIPVDNHGRGYLVIPRRRYAVHTPMAGRWDAAG